MSSTLQTKRRRRTPESAEREILEAAESFLSERPFRELTIDEVMARTTLSRPSFYVYFRDRHHLAVRLVEGIGGELFEQANRWLRGTGDPRSDIRDALSGLAAVYMQHGLVLRAIADASGHDPEVDRVYHGLINRFVDATTASIERDIGSGATAGLDARATSAALVWMTERYLLECLGRRPRQPAAKVVDALWTIWVRALYTSV